MQELIPKPDEAVKFEQLDDEFVLFNAKNTKVTYLNPSAAMVWSMCDGELSVGDIIAQLQEEFPEQKEQIANDVTKVLEDLQQNNLLQLV